MHEQDVLPQTKKKHAHAQAYVGENTNVESDAYLSPWLASDEQLRNLPPVYMVAATFDPLLDDAVWPVHIRYWAQVGVHMNMHSMSTNWLTANPCRSILRDG